MLTLVVGGACFPGAARAGAPGPPPAAGLRSAPAPVETIRELQITLARARERFEARDAAGVLAYVSDQYRSGPLTKAVIREQLLGIFGLYDAVRARVTIDAVDMVDGSVRVYTTGEVSGRLLIVKRWVTFLWWEREPEVARREGSVWRLFGFHEQSAGGGAALDRGVLDKRSAHLYPSLLSPALVLPRHLAERPPAARESG